MNDRFRTWAWLWLTLIIVLAAILRLYRLDELPPGLHYDEAFNATMAQRVVAGIERPIFFTEDLTEEPMAIYITALSFALFGASPWSLRLVSACAGILTIGALYFLACALFKSKLFALLSAFILAILYWHISFSRLGMEPIFVPLTLTLAVGFLWRALSEKNLWLWGLGGFFLASTQYTYKAALFVPVLVALFLGIEFLLDRELLTRNWRGWLIFALVAFLVFAPLGLYFATHPNQFLERPSTVTENTGLATIAENSMRVAGMFFIQGDANPRSNLPNRPALDPFLAIGFVLGIVMCIARWRKRESRFLLLWLGVMVLPSILTDFAPHFGRSIGVTPAIALITASGFTTIIDKARTLQRPIFFAVSTIFVIGLATSSLATIDSYFNIWASRTGNFISFDVGYLTLAQKLRARPEQTLYLSPVEREHYTIQFGLAGRKASSFDGRRVLVLSDTPAVYGIVTAEDDRLLARLQKFFPRAQVVDTIYDWTGKPYAAIFQTTSSAPVIAPDKIGERALRRSDPVDRLRCDAHCERNRFDGLLAERCRNAG